jgi:hypothetical protein
VPTQSRRPAREQKARAARIVREQHHGDRGGPTPIDLPRAALERGEMRPRAGEERVH